MDIRIFEIDITPIFRNDTGMTVHNIYKLNVNVETDAISARLDIVPTQEEINLLERLQELVRSRIAPMFMESQ